MSRLLVLGDIHGSHRALVQVLERANVDRENDRVIFLGDVADGWPDTRQCVDELLTLKKLTAILGNHDYWSQRWAETGWQEPVWFNQGGKATIQSYGGDPRNVPDSHREFLDTAKHWHQDGDRMFVHGGWEMHKVHPMMASPEKLMWDRTLWEKAKQRSGGDKHRITRFAEVYIGHTATELSHPDLLPVRACEVWNVDQGCGWGGKLTLLDVFQKTGIKPSTLSRLESRPSTRPGVDTAHRLSMFYGITTQKLFPIHDVGGAK